MSFQFFKTDFYCFGGKHRFGTIKIYDDITSDCSKVITGYCSISSSNRKKSLTVSGNTIQAEGLGSFIKNPGRTSVKAGKNLATNVKKNPGRVLEITLNIAKQPQPKDQNQLYHHYRK